MLGEGLEKIENLERIEDFAEARAKAFVHIGEIMLYVEDAHNHLNRLRTQISALQKAGAMTHRAVVKIFDRIDPALDRSKQIHAEASKSPIRDFRAKVNYSTLDHWITWIIQTEEYIETELKGVVAMAERQLDINTDNRAPR